MNFLADLSLKLIPSRSTPRAWLAVACALSCITFQSAHADLFHYSNLLIGPRALGLGGAFTALSDDASGLYYNPGGLALQNSLEVSASINTFYLKKNTFDNVFGEKQFSESARGSVSSFFGLSKRISLPILGPLQVGLVFINPDAALSDENVLFENEPEPNVIRYHRAANLRAGSSQVILGAAKRIGKDTGLGCAISYLDVDELEQVYQDVVQGPFRADELPGTNIYSTLGQNVRSHLVLRGGGVRCGFRIGFATGIQLGVSYQKTDIVFQNLEYDLEINKVYTDENNKIVQAAGSDKAMLQGTLQRNILRSQSNNVVTTWPNELRLGLAYQPWKAVTLSADAAHYGAGTGSDVRVKRAAILNLAAGTEIMLANTLYLRAGWFTNKDATASRNLESADQRKEYMDYRGVSLSTGLKLKTGDYGIHYTEQRGTGLSEKVAGKRNTAIGKLQVISISASQSFQ